MRSVAVGFLLVLTSLTLAAQSGGVSYAVAGAEGLGQNSNSRPNATARQFKLNHQYKLEDLAQTLATVPACPIGLTATQGVWDHTMRVRDFDKGITIAPFGQHIVLTLADPRGAGVVSATVIVRGLDGKNHMLQTAGAQGPPVATKTMHVRFARQADGSTSGDLYVPGFTSVTSLQLQDATYSDGSTWRTSNSNFCRVKPNPMMLIAGQ